PGAPPSVLETPDSAARPCCSCPVPTSPGTASPAPLRTPPPATHASAHPPRAQPSPGSPTAPPLRTAPVRDLELRIAPPTRCLPSPTKSIVYAKCPYEVLHVGMSV